MLGVVEKTYSTGEVFGSIGAPSKRWLDNQLNDGRFPGRKFGRSWRMTERDVADAIEICKNDFDGVVSDAPSGLTPARSDSGLRSQVSSRSTRSPEADDEASRGDEAAGQSRQRRLAEQKRAKRRNMKEDNE